MTPDIEEGLERITTFVGAVHVMGLVTGTHDAIFDHIVSGLFAIVHKSDFGELIDKKSSKVQR